MSDVGFHVAKAALHIQVAYASYKPMEIVSIGLVLALEF